MVSLPRRTLRSLLVGTAVAALVATSGACAPDTSEDTVAGDQAIADDEIALSTVPIGPDGRGAPSSAPAATKAATWRAFLVAKRAAPSETYPVLVAYDANGRETYEALVVADGGSSRIALRSPSGAPMRMEKDPDGRPHVRIGELDVDVHAVFSDWLAIAGETAPSGGTIRTQALGSATCGEHVRKTIAGAAAAGLGGILAVVSCTMAAGTGLVLAPATVGCAVTASSALAGAWTVYANAGKIRASCSSS